MQILGRVEQKRETKKVYQEAREESAEGRRKGVRKKEKSRRGDWRGKKSRQSPEYQALLSGRERKKSEEEGLQREEESTHRIPKRE